MGDVEIAINPPMENPYAGNYPNQSAAGSDVFNGVFLAHGAAH